MTLLPLILLMGGGLALILLVVGIAITVTSERSLVEERLGRYIEDEAAAKASKGEKTSAVKDWFNVQVEKSSWGEKVARELARADLKLKAGEYVFVVILIGLAAGFVSWYFLGQNIIVGIVGLLIGILVPRFYVRRQQNQRLNRFNSQLADMLNLMVNGLRAGFSTMQAMEAVSRELPAPISDEFRRVVQETQLGIPMERALENLLRRIPSEDLDLLITAINVQREVGGNLAEILDTISHTIRERVRIKGEIRVLTSQVTYSGRFLSMMPLFIFGALWVLNRPYMMQFFNPDTRIVGIIALVISGIMIISGSLVMRKISDIDV
jgi:tight adherence protein B